LRVPDWRKLVERRVGSVRAVSAEQDEIAAELASHLEDVYADHRAQGSSEVEAADRALQELADGRSIGRRIRNSKEGGMNERTRRFWLPALASISSACVLVAVVAQLSYLPRVVLIRSGTATLVYPAWLLGQPLLGALGAYCSRRAGGNRLTRLTAGLAPSIVMFVAACIVVFAHTVLQVRGDFGAMDLAPLARAVVVGILIPGIAVLLGTLPFLSDPKPSAAA
jgi:hypothetical protein